VSGVGKLAQYVKPLITSLTCGSFIGGLIYKGGGEGALLGSIFLIILTIGSMELLVRSDKKHVMKHLEYGMAGLLPGAIVTLHTLPSATKIEISAGMVLGMLVFAIGIARLIRRLEKTDKYLSTTWEIISFSFISFGSILFTTWFADFIFGRNHILNPCFAVLLSVILSISPGLTLAANRHRPVLGNSMTFLGGVLVLWFGISIAPMLFLPGSGLYWAGIVIGLTMIALSILGVIFPQMGLLLGSLHIVVSILSFVGATGGLLAGGLLGVLGGVFVVAWNGCSSSIDTNDTDFVTYTVESNSSNQQISV
jgi:hypothetical protein